MDTFVEVIFKLKKLIVLKIVVLKDLVYKI